MIAPPPSRLTAEQAEALAVTGASVALSAGAGCGKTTVLTERFVRALDGPTPISLGKIVALTFTNKAARELRDRIRRECRLKVEAGVDPTYWRGVVRGLEAARIGTFHAFCGEVLRGHAIEAGIDPGFTVLDEPVAAALRDEALAQALRDRLAHRDRNLIELAVDFGLGAVRTALGSLLTNRAGDDLDRWASMEPENLVRIWLDRWTLTVRPDLLGSVAAACAPLLSLIGRTTFDHPKTFGRMSEFAAAVERVEAIGPGDPVPALKALQEAAKVQGLTGKGAWPSADIYEVVKAGFEDVRETIKKVVPALVWDEATSLAAAVHGIRFARLASHARATFERMKRARSAVDHDDLLLLVRDLVTRESPTVRDALAESIDLILVDEFQDTDPVQGDILASLTGGDPTSGRLFLVGDFKQSIYRFRGADPDLFRDFRDRVPDAGRRNLTANFRSVPGVLSFVNALFATTFTEAGTALQPGNPGLDQAGPPAVLFSWGGPPVPVAGAKPGKPDATLRRQDEARRLAGYLADRLAEGWMIRDPRTGQPRRAHAGDVAILFRSLADSGMYEQALVAEGLDFHVVGGSGFFAQLEVLDLINVLSAVEDPTDSLALAGALRSPFFALSDDALFWLAVECPGAIHQGLERFTPDRAERLPEADRPRVERARTLLARWRGSKDAVPIGTLVDRILSDSGYEAALLGEWLGDRKRANARKLVRMARRLDDAGGFTLADFVARLRADLRAATKETQASTTDDAGEIVRLMSIHQAKGLEFPIVVVPDLDRKRPGELRRVAFDADLGPLVNPVADADDGSDSDDGADTGCLGWSVYRHMEKKADDAEALRLFYVATTRARDFLILSAATDPTRDPTSPTLTLLDRQFNRSTGSFLSSIPAEWPIPRVEVIPAATPTGPGPTRRSSQRPIPLLEVAELIRTAQLRPDLVRSTPRWTDLPRWVALDPTPTTSTTAARLDLLCRAILADTAAFNSEATPAIAERVARLQDPVAGRRLIDLAVPRFQIWLAALPPIFQDDRNEWSPRWEWTVAYASPAKTAAPTVFAGWGDCRCRLVDGSTILLCVGDASLDPMSEDLRVMLAARSLADGGAEPVAAWWVPWEIGPEPRRFDRFDATAVRLAAETWAAIPRA